MFSPYIINSNIITQISETSDYPTMLNAVGTNLGNSYITYGLIKSLYGKLVNLNSINFFWKTNPKKLESELEKINNSSHVFFIFQDFIRPKNLQFKLDYKATSDFIKRINKPIIIPNIGMNDFEYNTNIYTRFSTELIDFLRVLSEHSNFIGVRGKYTQEVLAKLGIKNTMITGCPSYYEMGRNRIIKKYTNIPIMA